MSVYKKLAEARVKLQQKSLQKSGRNHFIKVKVEKKGDNGRTYYQDEPMPYFELGDFLPSINNIFNEIGLCSVVSFTDKLATLTIFDVESDGKIEFSSPMPPVPTEGKNGAIASNNLMQSIGALETYQRRYLYVMALEIVENDAIDSQDFSEKKEESPKPKSPPNSDSSTKQNMSSTPKNNSPQQANLSPEEKFKQRFSTCKNKDEMNAMYDKLVNWVQKNAPELQDTLDIVYNDALLNLI